MSEFISVLNSPGAVALIGAIATLCGIVVGHVMSVRAGDRLRVWNQKRDIYAALLGSLNELDMVGGAIAQYCEMDRTPWIASQVEKLNEQRYSVIKEFGKTRELARMFLNSQALNALAELDAAARSKGKSDNEFRKDLCGTIEKISNRLIAAAQKELAV